MSQEWRRIPQRERPYDAYRLERYIEPSCDHHGPYCRCDPPFHLRESTPAEEERAARMFWPLEVENV